MSELMSALQNIELIALDRINLISNMQIQAKYENAEYRFFIDKLLNNLNDTKSIDIYNLFLALNSEICLNLAEIEKIPEIISSYYSFLSTKFTEISPTDTKQKSELTEKGINKFLFMLETNFAEIKDYNKLSSKDIQSIIDLVQNLISFFEENDLGYDNDTKLQLNKTLNKIKDSLLLEEKKHQESDVSSYKETTNESPSQDKQTYLPENINNVTTGSTKWTTLIEKIEVLKSLVDSGRIFETSVVYNDIQNLLANFDPKEYFPEAFFPLYKKIAPFIGDIHKNIDYYSSSIQWSIANKMYQIDYNQFLENLEKMPENNFLDPGLTLAKEHFYETSSEAKGYAKESNKLLENEDAYKQNINLTAKNTNRSKDNNNQLRNIKDVDLSNTETQSSDSEEDDLNKLFDF
ncbi:type VI secretion system protein IglI family protein [Francisella opportunistica]|uniref:type VI secretion system protein IglI family protein n=1 Tax=Francisella opportunistica TaxID=2016517 RepID=UPI000E0ACA60|nr:type VI secretion system protein IglI family protein [Francisella opportunistica]AXH32806.1 phage tail protein [Francisella opportunistica]